MRRLSNTKDESTETGLSFCTVQLALLRESLDLILFYYFMNYPREVKENLDYHT